MTSAFVRAHTRLGSAPHVPEIQLHLAEDAFDLWERVEDQVGEKGLAPPFWAFAWAGGQALARYVLDNPSLVAGRSVLDLAAGCGVVALAAAKAGARRVVANEIDQFAIDAILLNAEANELSVQTEYGDMLDGDADGFDVVLAGDIFYDTAVTSRMMPFIHRLRTRDVTVLVGDPGRAHLPREQFTRVAHYEVPVPTALENAEIKTTTVWQPR
ncbi:class I SAM-dependent methyltransferase [Kibdelosporangium phytohabitans]|uniref:50S ribosomal protein L11 methyltransferase n=1 Tax=Kibdelosporangium phytohabitans TaxID=860235 RepID=A0A0N9I215_9PSEU|nr:50S ribosomal protein L11 methyltransferase [Kibdelosporangium phytohabitans]ALG10064.1 50S ribosomal protein L11 methyltransferase [Kibdelosporangium phytohabitans]MBE1461036.1 putative nicotinamide N-methyase [Kibdelosporangium phytohabitans]